MYSCETANAELRRAYLSRFYPLWITNKSDNPAIHTIMVSCFHIYRPQTKFAKVMFSRVSVCPLGGGMRGRGYAWPGACMAGGCMIGGMHGRGHVWQGACIAGGHAWQERWPLQRAVCILLECILVGEIFSRNVHENLTHHARLKFS